MPINRKDWPELKENAFNRFERRFEENCPRLVTERIDAKIKSFHVLQCGICGRASEIKAKSSEEAAKIATKEKWNANEKFAVCPTCSFKG